jgi:hypothetical protein
MHNFIKIKKLVQLLAYRSCLTIVETEFIKRGYEKVDK